MQSTDREALRAAADQGAADAFISKHRQYILRCASKCAHRFITESDDEWSVALIAFSEALSSYAQDKGPFLPFAELVIRRRLADYYRREAKHAGETDVDPAVFEGGAEPESGDAALQSAVLQKTAKEDPRGIRDEIEAIGSILAEYGFSFYDLADCSPKTGKTRKSCAAAVRYLLSAQPVLLEMRRTHTLPIGAVCRRTGLQEKILERHRRFIIAAAEILQGDYPHIAEYLSFIGKEEAE